MRSLSHVSAYISRSAFVNKSTMSNLIDLVGLSVSAAKRAGETIRKVKESGDLKLVNKSTTGKFDPQTEADRKAQMIIVSILNKRFPELQIYGEEDVSAEEKEIYEKEINTDCDIDPCVSNLTCPPDLIDIKIPQLRVWIDPLDGTGDFSKGQTEHVTVLIGIATDDGKPIAGVIHQPFFIDEKDSSKTENTVWGIVGLGAFGLQYKSRVMDGILINTSNSHNNSSNMKCCEAMKADKILHQSGCAYKMLKVLQQEVDALVYARSGTMKWDICACDALFRACNGKLTDLEGNCYKYDCENDKSNKMGLIATLKNHDRFVSHVPKEILDDLKSRL